MSCRITADPMKPAPPLIKRRMLGHPERFDDESLTLPESAEHQPLQSQQRAVVLLQARELNGPDRAHKPPGSAGATTDIHRDSLDRRPATSGRESERTAPSHRK